MTMSRTTTTLLTAVSLVLAACSDRQADAADQQLRNTVVAEVVWELPVALGEASGAVAVSDRHILLHNDEFADVYQLDIDSGEVSLVLSLEGKYRRGRDQSFVLTMMTMPATTSGNNNSVSTND